MKPFSLVFEGRAALSITSQESAQMECKLLMSGSDPETIGKAMGTFADHYLKHKKDPHLASVIIIAFYQFMSANPGISPQDLRLLAGDSLQIMPDNMKIIKTIK